MCEIGNAAWRWRRGMAIRGAGDAGEQGLRLRREGRIRRIIIVAVARKLVIALWRYLEIGLVPSGAELKA
jgi:hypothetical protein